MDRDIEKVLVSKEEITEICRRLGEEITRDYQGKKLLLVSVLKGAAVFMADIMREIKCPLTIDFMAISSYQNSTKSSGVVQFKKDLDINPEGYDVLIIEDILDSGLSLKNVTEVLRCRGVNSLKICAFLDKPETVKPISQPITLVLQCQTSSLLDTDLIMPRNIAIYPTLAY